MGVPRGRDVPGCLCAGRRDRVLCGPTCTVCFACVSGMVQHSWGLARPAALDQDRSLYPQVQRFRERVLAGGRVMHAQARRAVSFVARKSVNLAWMGDGARRASSHHGSRTGRGVAAVVGMDGRQERGQSQLHNDSDIAATNAQDGQEEFSLQAGMDAEAVDALHAQMEVMMPAAAADEGLD